VVFAWRVQAIDAQRRPVEARFQLGQGGHIDGLVDLNRAQQTILSETLDENVDDLGNRRCGSPSNNWRS
jgi:hypothetical protein